LERGLDFDPLPRGLGAFAIGIERGEPVAEQFVETDDAVFHHLVKAAEFVVGTSDFGL
jgi:hypothetical protein